MNTSIQLKLISPFTFIFFIALTEAFSQSVTILPKSQTNTDTLSTKFIRMTNGAGKSKVMVSDNAGNGRWTDTLSTKFFRMTEGAGFFNVMISDSLGNGVWVPPIALTDNYWTRNNTNQLYLTLPVNLGIGTGEPAYKLDVRHATSPILANFSGNTSTGAGIRISSGVSGTLLGVPISSEWQIFHSGTDINNGVGGYGQLHFRDQNGTKMILRNNGRLGIGVLNPAEMLEVNGNARINGRIEIRNTGGSVFVGEQAGASDDLSLNNNTFIGLFAGTENVTGGDNVAIGAGSMENNVSGSTNTAVGRLALINNISGSNNVAIGASAGFNSTGNANIFIGNNAGSDATGSDKLYIHNSNTPTPLIYGDFLERNLGVNGRLIIGAHAPLENASKLDVIANENARFIVQSWTPSNDNTLVVSRLLSTTSKAPQMRFQGIGASYIDIGQDTNGSFVVEGGDNSRFVVENTGQVGIGTKTPASQLEIVSTANETLEAASSSATGTWFFLKNTSTGGKSWRFISTGNSNGEGSGNLLIKDDTNVRMIFKHTSGLVGIGTIDPQAHLEVSTTNNEALRATSSSVTGTWLGINNTSTGGKNWKFISTGSGNSEGVGHLLLKNDSGSKLIVKNNGAVGIGTETPTQAKLVIEGSLTSNLAYGYLNSSGSTGTAGANGADYYSIYTSDRIATTEINVYSDARIKKAKGQSDNAKDLDILKNIQITDYQLIDSISKGNTNYKKVIAQQVEKVYPSAVTKMTDFIPDIYQLSSIDKGFIPLVKTTLKEGDKLKLISDEKQEVVEVLSVSTKGIQVNSEKSGKVFVYGREVNDFRSVDYEALTTLNISATQALLKRIETLEKENSLIKQLAKEVENLKNQVLANNQQGK